jgi:hypothetical protein
MQVSIQILRDDQSVRAVLQKDGWHLQSEERSDAMSARHPEVKEEKAARQRLSHLGLLTCRTCRIEFQR